MTMFGGGWSIFAASLRSVLQRPGTALGLWLGVGSVFFFLELVRSLDFHRGGDGNPGMLGSIIVEILLVAIIAVSWHRAVLRPGQKDVKFGRWVRYGLAWFVNGLVIGLLLLPLAAILFFVANLIITYARFGSYFEWSIYIETASVWGMFLLEGPFLGLAAFFFGALFLWLLYRLAIGLPHIAVEDSDLRFRESWARTKPLAGPIFGVSVIASAAQLPLLVGPSIIGPDIYGDSVVTDLPATIWLSFGYALVILIGAAILTEIYRRTEPNSPPELV